MTYVRLGLSRVPSSYLACLWRIAVIGSLGDTARQVCDAMEDQMAEGYNVVDYHGCDFFPERRVASSVMGRIKYIMEDGSAVKEPALWLRVLTQ